MISYEEIHGFLVSSMLYIKIIIVALIVLGCGFLQLAHHKDVDRFSGGVSKTQFESLTKMMWRQQHISVLLLFLAFALMISISVLTMGGTGYALAVYVLVGMAMAMFIGAYAWNGYKKPEFPITPGVHISFSLVPVFFAIFAFCVAPA